jgi:16S rRNA (cytosine1402-N4)-methyltransferase
MMAGSDGTSAVAGGSARHIPVLARQVFDFLQPRDGGIYIDGTFGAGGHTRAILNVAGARVIGIDRDRNAVTDGFALVERAAGRLTLVEDRFSNLEHVARSLGHDAVDGILLDLGVSSMQLDEPERGFSFRNDGPLDMRMGGEGPSASDLVNAAPERDLSRIIATLGEERFARLVARAIVKAREEPIMTTRQLDEVVGSVVRSRPGEIHPATRTFQALRMFVNDELGELAAGLAAAERMLKSGGRLVVISFHSLEDRIVKIFLAERGRVRAGSRHQPEAAKAPPSFEILTRKPVTADDDEVSRNPRSRSAKLRAAERSAAAPIAGDPADLLPRLPILSDVMRRR